MATQESVPRSLFHTGRAQCPDCGAALQLIEDGAFAQCSYCGGSAVVERRLRTIEPVISEGFITADAPLDTARKIKPSHIIDTLAQDESHCPTCGIEMGPADTQAIRKCKHCGTQSKIERRLLRSPEADKALAARERDADDSEKRQFGATSALFEIVEKGSDLAERVKAAYELGEMWIHANARAARLLPRILKVMQGSDPRLELHLAELVGKLLCNNDVVLANAVLRAAEKFTFNVNGPQSLLRALSLGSGVGLKLLLDTADYAGKRGATEYACSALWAVNTMIERNYAGRMRLAEIVLYRLLYLKGPVQAWAIELAKGQLGLGCRFTSPVILHFIDDCVAERPELVKHVREFFYHGQAENDGEYTARLQLVNQLLTTPAKISALEHIYAPPTTISEKTAGECLRQLIEMTRDSEIQSGAIKAIIDWIDDSSPLRPCVQQMVKEIGDELPEEIRRAYLQREPKTPHLTPLKVKYNDYEKEKPTAFDEQLEAWRQMWDTGIRQAVDRHHERQAVSREYWEQIRKRK